MSRILLLILFFVTEVNSKPPNYICSKLSQPMHCVDHPRVRTTKSAETYQLNLCFNDQCSENITFTFRCKEICEACKTLTPSNSCTKDAECEQEVDVYLNSYCACATVAIDRPTMKSHTAFQTIMNPIHTTQSSLRKDLKVTSITVRPSRSHSVTDSPRSTTVPFICDATSSLRPKTPTETLSPSKFEVNTNILVIVLGALLGLSVVLLVIVITGWVCTCWSKNQERAKGRKRATTVTVASTNNSDEAQSPTHETTTRESMFLAARYEEVNLLSEENREAPYHILETRASHDNDGSLNHMHKDGDSEVPRRRYDAINLLSNKNRENYNVLDRGQGNEGGNVVERDVTTVEKSCQENQTSNGLPAVSRYDAANVLSEENGDYSVLERVQESGEDELGEVDRNSRTSNNLATRYGDGLYHVLESGEGTTTSGGDGQNIPITHQGTSKDSDVPAARYDEVYLPTEDNEDSEVFYHELESGPANGGRETQSNPKSRGNLRDNDYPAAATYDAVQLVSVSHDDGEDYDVLDRGQGNSVKEEPYFKSVGFEGNANDNVFFGVRYDTVMNPSKDDHDDDDYDVLDKDQVNDEYFKNPDVHRGYSKDGRVRQVTYDTVTISSNDDDNDYDMLESLKV